MPFEGIFINVFYVLFVILTVTDYVIIGAILPYISAVFLVAKSFEGRHKT
jgi:hypothetical protein